MCSFVSVTTQLMNVLNCRPFATVCWTLSLLPPAENWLDENTRIHKLTDKSPSFATWHFCKRAGYVVTAINVVQIQSLKPGFVCRESTCVVSALVSASDFKRKSNQWPLQFCLFFFLFLSISVCHALTFSE